MTSIPCYVIEKDDLAKYAGKHNTFFSFGEVMIRETPSDLERLERSRLVHISMAGSEFSIAIGLSRLGIPVGFVTRLPDNPYGWAVRNIARENGVNTDYFVWASKTDLIGRMLYEIGLTPRKSVVIYQRKFSAASMVNEGMIDWKTALDGTRLFHTSGITFSISSHSGYETNYPYLAFREAMKLKSVDCLVGLDINYRSTLWSKEKAGIVLDKVIGDYVDILNTTFWDMAELFGFTLDKKLLNQSIDGDSGRIADEEILRFAEGIFRRFGLKIISIPIHYKDDFGTYRCESVAVNRKGDYFRSPIVRPIKTLDRLGGGDAWNSGFYYGLLTAGEELDGLRKGVLIGDAMIRLQQTLMFDLPIIEKSEIDKLLYEDINGSLNYVER